MFNFSNKIEEVLFRFPHLGEAIIKKLSNADDSKLREVSRTWQKFVDTPRIFDWRMSIRGRFMIFLKFIYSEKATKFCKIFTLLLSYVVPVKSKVKISQNFVAFSEYVNFKTVSFAPGPRSSYSYDFVSTFL